VTLNRVRTGRANAGWPCECGCAQRAPFYPTDLSDKQWAVLEPLLPVMLCGTPLGGRPERHGRKRHLLLDTMGLLIAVGGHPRQRPGPRRGRPGAQSRPAPTAGAAWPAPGRTTPTTATGATGRSESSASPSTSSSSPPASSASRSCRVVGPSSAPTPGPPPPSLRPRLRAPPRTP
jgi:hypothetical protein